MKKMFDFLKKDKKQKIKLCKGRGDLFIYPVEDDCKILLENYTKSQEFKKKGFKTCRIIECRGSNDEKECRGKITIGGCAVCVLECE